MKLKIKPGTKMGKWSVGLGIIFIILIWLKIQFFLPVPVFAIAALGLAGFVLSLIALIKNRDRSILLFIPVLVGSIIIIWASAELIFPH
jgi:hypothetical protein